MKKKADRPLAGMLILAIAAGIGLLALLVLAPGYAQAGLNGAQPVSVQSALLADYSADPLGQHIQPISLRAVAEALADQANPTQSGGLSNQLKTLVAIVTPAPGSPVRASSTALLAKSATPIRPATLTPMPKVEIPATQTPPLPVHTAIPPLSSPTARPTLAFMRTLVQTLAARPTNTLVLTATLRPATITSIPAVITQIAATRTQPPATATRVLPTLPGYPPPAATATRTTVATATVRPYP